MNMDDGQPRASKRSKAEDGLPASTCGQAAPPVASDASVEGKQTYPSIFDRMCNDLSDDEIPYGLLASKHPLLKMELGSGQGPAAVPPEKGLGAGLSEGHAPKRKASKGKERSFWERFLADSSASEGSASEGEDVTCPEDGRGAVDGTGGGGGLTQQNPTEEFGEELAYILQVDPPLPETPTALAQQLLSVSTDNAPSVRGWLLTCAKEQAGDCDCETPLPRWTKVRRADAATCGRQQAKLVSEVDIQAVLERQKERGGDDDVPYILARTVRSCLQYNAAAGIGCKGAGNQCKRGPCFKRAMGMFSGDHMDGVPKEVVLALLRH